MQAWEHPPEWEERSGERGPDFLRGGGDMGARMRAHDWSRTPLGPPATWPQSLRTSVSTCLNCAFPILLWWGPELVMLYNDEYRLILGPQKHPAALGAPGRHVWSEIWDVIGPMLGQVIARGEATRSRDLSLMMDRHGYVEETYFSFSYSPIRDESGGVGGVFTPVMETTAQVVGERRMRTLRDLAARGRADSLQSACREACGVLAENPQDIPFALIYRCDDDGDHAQLLCAAGAAEGSAVAPARIALEARDPPVWPIREALQRGMAVLVEDLGRRFASLPTGAWPDPPRQALVLPVATGREQVTVVLICAVNPRRALDAEHRGFIDLIAAQLGNCLAETLAWEDERRRAEALAEIDRAKTVFFSNVSHEFRTPLTLMLGPLEEALRRADLAPSLRDDLVSAHGNALRLLKLVNSLLDFARVEAGRAQARYQPTDLAALTIELASSFESLCRRAELEFEIDCKPLSQPVHVDRDMWEKIVLNLVSNAFKFTLRGRIAIRLCEEFGAAMLEVEDTGAGIPASELPRLFERFHRVEGVVGRTHEGSGIGLALVQELARLHGGTVAATSIEGKGSLFAVRIPFGTAHLPPDALQAGQPLAPTATGPDTFVAEASRWMSAGQQVQWEPDVAGHRTGPADDERPLVLVADDNADMRAYLRRLLSPHYEVVTADHGEAALDAVRTHRPDLVLADVMMPALDGFALLQRLRADPACRDLPIILLSARAGEEARVEGLEAGADDYMTKPFSARELLARIESNIKLAVLRRRTTGEVTARLREFEALVAATSDAVYRMNADWTEMRSLFGRDFLASTEAPIRSWLETYVDPADQLVVAEGIRQAIRTKGVFELEHRVRRIDGSVGWTVSRAIPLFDEHGDIVEWLGTASDVTERHLAQEQQQLLVRELNHRVKNLFAVAGGLVTLTARSAANTGEMAEAVRHRLSALARAHELAIPALEAGDARHSGAMFEALVRAICAPFLDGKGATGLVAEGPAVQLAGQAVTSFALVLNELVTNAVKYGALSVRSGRIEVHWARQDGRFRMSWTERGGPAVTSVPGTQGFGTLLARRTIEGQLGGTIAYDWARAGVRVDLSIPLERLSG